MVAERLRDCSVYFTQLRNHSISPRYICLDNIAIGENASKDTIEELLLALASGTVDKVPAKLEVHNLAQLLKECCLCLRRKLREHEVARRLPLLPVLLKRTRVESGECHKVHRLQLALVDIEFALRVAILRLLLALLQELTSLQTRNVKCLLNIRLKVDKSTLYQLIAGCCFHEKFL